VAGTLRYNSKVLRRPNANAVRIVPREEPVDDAPELRSDPPIAPGPRRASSETRLRATRAPFADDAEILEGVKRGEPAAAVALHDRVRPNVERTIARLLGRHDRDAEDLAQHSMIELVRSLRGFRGDCSLDTWTSRVTAHAVFKEIRRRRSARSVFDENAEVGTDDASPVDPDRDAAMRSALRRVRHHVAALDDVKAWTVLLHDVSGYDLREIAEITEVSVAAAQARLVRGRRDLHARIEADPELRELLEQWRGKSRSAEQPGVPEPAADPDERLLVGRARR
jgi:RNA polymerase sigma-70 factor (ECF subfamily)